MLKVGQRVISRNKGTWFAGTVVTTSEELPLTLLQRSPTEPSELCEVGWDDQYIGLAYESSLLPIPSKVSYEQQKAILNLIRCT